MDEYKIVIINLNTKIEENLFVQVDEAETSEDIVITAMIDKHKISAGNYNYLPAYQEFRDTLLQLGYGMKCQASRMNAVQSGMMACSSKIYLVEKGKRALMNNIAYMFDYADISEFPTTEQQIAFANEWYNSFGKCDN